MSISLKSKAFLLEYLNNPEYPIIPNILLVYFLVRCLPFFVYYHMSSYSYVELSDDEWLVTRKSYEDKPKCPIIPQFETGDWSVFRMKTNYEFRFQKDKDMEESESQSVTRFRKELIEANFQHRSSWMPKMCNPVHNVTIIVPYRNRLHQLKKLILHIHPFLKFQKVSYRIVIVEQMNNVKFNRAKLFNVGFAESEKRFPSDCYIFHDVDLIPEHLQNMYGCTKLPRLMSASMNSWRYLLSYDEYLGGVTSISRKQFLEINGYSNSYQGWGGEDDDFYKRVVGHNFTVTRFNPAISSYLMTPHIKEMSGNNEQIYETAEERFTSDGLNDLNYTLVAFEDGIGFTTLKVNV